MTDTSMSSVTLSCILRIDDTLRTDIISHAIGRGTSIGALHFIRIISAIIIGWSWVWFKTSWYGGQSIWVSSIYPTDIYQVTRPNKSRAIYGVRHRIPAIIHLLCLKTVECKLFTVIVLSMDSVEHDNQRRAIFDIVKSIYQCLPVSFDE